MRLLALYGIFVTSLFADEGKTFQFLLEKGDVYAVDKYQDIVVKEKNSGRTETREERNRIVLKVLDNDEKSSSLEGVFSTYSRTPRLVGQFKRDKDYPSKFEHFTNGAYKVGDQYIMPNLRGLPTFPDRPLKVGDEWEAPAMETMDFENVKVKIPIQVRYKYIGPDQIQSLEGEKCDCELIEYSYQFLYKIPDSRSPVLRIQGASADRLWFDPKKGIPIFDSNRLIYNFQLEDGRIMQYAFRIDSNYKKYKILTSEEKTKIKEDITKDLENRKDIQVRESAEGIVLDLSDILFNLNSADLNADSLKSVSKIAEILKKYPDREIRISGHTDSTGKPEYNQKLSEARAKSVVSELQKSHDIDAKRLSYKGYGEKQPIAENSTPEGRSKNRRVEVLIVTE